MIRPQFKTGDIVQHFKRDMQSDKALKENPTLYLYEVIGLVQHTETKEFLMAYKSLYTRLDVHTGDVYVRPIDMFYSKTDKVKYPDAKQEYRFEKYCKE